MFKFPIYCSVHHSNSPTLGAESTAFGSLAESSLLLEQECRDIAHSFYRKLFSNYFVVSRSMYVFISKVFSKHFCYSVQIYFIAASNQFLNTIKKLKNYLPQIYFPDDTM